MTIASILDTALEHRIIVVGAGAAIALIALAAHLLRKRSGALTSAVSVQEDEEMIEAELTVLNKIASKAAAEGSSPALPEGAMGGAAAGKSGPAAVAAVTAAAAAAAIAADAAAIARTASPTASLRAAPAQAAQPAQESSAKSAGELALKSILVVEKMGRSAAKKGAAEGKAAAGTAGEIGEAGEAADISVDIASLDAAEKSRIDSLRDMIARTRVLLRSKSRKKAYVLYLKIRREYDRLPKRIQMLIRDEYNGVRNDINRTIPELEVVEDIAQNGANRPAKELEKGFLDLLARTDEALDRGEKERAYLLYSEIKGMYHLVPPGIKHQVYERCVSIYRRCVG